MPARGQAPESGCRAGPEAIYIVQLRYNRAFALHLPASVQFFSGMHLLLYF